MPDLGKGDEPPMMMTVRHTDKSVHAHGDIDQQLRYILIPEKGRTQPGFFSGNRDRDGR